jgi:hypothetical protein
MRIVECLKARLPMLIPNYALSPALNVYRQFKDDTHGGLHNEQGK